MKKLGIIEKPEQYFLKDELVLLDDSIKAKKFFDDEYGDGGFVAAALIKLDTLKNNVVPVWAYIKDADDQLDFTSFCTIFADQFLEDVLNSEIEDIILIEQSMLYIHNDIFYAFTGTSNGEIVVKRMRAFLFEQDVIDACKLLGYEVDECYVAELWSLSKQEFICVCWAVTMVDDNDFVFWYPILIEDGEKLAKFDPDDVEEYPIGANQTLKIADDNFVLRFDDKTGFYLDKMGKFVINGKEFDIGGKNYIILPEIKKENIKKISKNKILRIDISSHNPAG